MPIQRLSPLEAQAAMQAEPEALLIDVRDPVEFAFVGYPVGAINVPWKFAPEMRANPDFLADVGRLAPSLDTPLYLICRSGQRSLAAAEALAGVGYRCVVNIEEGFEGPLDDHKRRGALGGWRYHGLPWQQA
ncbi:MAG: rhodanese-like domain-containing protein [Methylococcus sp.]